jgi:hypothetical protein
MKKSKIPGEDSLTLLIYASLTNVSTKYTEQLYLLFSNSQTFYGLHRKKYSQIMLIL